MKYTMTQDTDIKIWLFFGFYLEKKKSVKQQQEGIRNWAPGMDGDPGRTQIHVPISTNSLYVSDLEATHYSILFCKAYRSVPGYNLCPI